MTTIFYLFGIFAIMWEGITMTQPAKVSNRMLRLKETSKGEWKNHTEQDKSLTILHGLYFAWVVVGLFSSSWPLFLIVLLISLIPKPKPAWVLSYFIDGLLTFCVLVFIIVNKMHLHIDITNMLLNAVR